MNATEQEQIKFSKQLTDRLEDLRNGGELEKLVLVAPPRFLGMLRGDLSRPLASLVVHSVDKELTAETPEGIAEKLPDFL